MVEVFLYLAFGLGAAIAFHVGGVGHEQAYAAVFGKACKVGARVSYAVAKRGRVELEVTGMDDFAHGGFHRKGATLGYGMFDGDEMEGQATQLHRAVSRHGDEFHTLQHAMFAKLVLNKGQSEGRTVNTKATQTFILMQEPR